MNEPGTPEMHLPASAEPRDVLQVVTRILESLSDDDGYRKAVTRFVPGAGKVYGVRVPQLRDLADQILKAYRTQSPVVAAIADDCWQVGSREHCVLAILILAGSKTLQPAQRWEHGLRFLPDVSDWETCDHLCMGLLGQALAEDARYMDALEQWPHDNNLWVRRAALASTVLLRRAKFEPATLQSLNQRTLGICQCLLEDKEHYVRKAVDWAVREVIWRDYAIGAQWLLERAGGPLTSVARSTLKKSAKKLSPADQERFHRALE
ncbi:MAG: DNA alkylation repair protein [Anaerolineales bacterium]|nr:MAG: DNA alkylation repair protein [Anaerolineales bacterium]